MHFGRFFCDYGGVSVALGIGATPKAATGLSEFVMRPRWVIRKRSSVVVSTGSTTVRNERGKRLERKRNGGKPDRPRSGRERPNYYLVDE